MIPLQTIRMNYVLLVRLVKAAGNRASFISITPDWLGGGVVVDIIKYYFLPGVSLRAVSVIPLQTIQTLSALWAKRVRAAGKDLGSSNRMTLIWCSCQVS